MRGAGPLGAAPFAWLLVLRIVRLPLSTTLMIRDVSFVIIAVRSDIQHSHDVRQRGIVWPPLLVRLVMINTGPAGAAVNLVAATILALDQPKGLIEPAADIFQFI